MDMRQSILMDVELGIGVDYIDPDLRLKRKTMRKNVVAQRMKEDTRGEDLRVLYVALTSSPLLLWIVMMRTTSAFSSRMFASPKSTSCSCMVSRYRIKWNSP